MLLLFFFRFLPCSIPFSYVPDLHKCRILLQIFISWTVIVKFLKMVCIYNDNLYRAFFMIIVPVEPTCFFSLLS